MRWIAALRAAQNRRVFGGKERPLCWRYRKHCRGRFHCARRRVSEAKDRKARLLGRRSSREPRDAANARGRDESRPYGPGGKSAANRNPRATATHVGAHIVRPGNPAAARGFGRGMPLPYTPSGHDRPNGTAAAARTAVGRDALIPPKPAAAQTPAGGINPSPTTNRRSAAKRDIRRAAFRI